MIRFAKDALAYRITLDAPPLHVLDIPMLGALRDALRQVQADRHLLLIDATGDRAFCAGVSVEDHLGERVGVMLETFHDCFRILTRLEVVTVALVRAAALGGGAELAGACDFVLASEHATFGQPEIRLGVFAPVASWQLSRHIAPRKGLELLLTGDAIDARTAAGLGLVNAVFAASEFETRSGEWLERLTRHSATSLRMEKKAFRLAQADALDERLELLERLYLDELVSTADATEGLNAFLEKRAPRWTNG